jgi:hypothetical protein
VLIVGECCYELRGGLSWVFDAEQEEHGVWQAAPATVDEKATWYGAVWVKRKQ